MEEELEVYEAPEVLSFGDLDFEPMGVSCTTFVTCGLDFQCFDVHTG